MERRPAQKCAGLELAGFDRSEFIELIEDFGREKRSNLRTRRARSSQYAYGHRLNRALLFCRLGFASL
jgi:hypothetical protein